ncbi:LOW QUALITY PROTEIN: uncharacterized protein LOC141964342 [Athene noctua]|uniref:LOW QUALITY PROTEIN: uncharacterized protein LOC141964342 n=1 Tax=Athene noctua TaxID=126797 RepID=UPI003EBC8B94
MLGHLRHFGAGLRPCAVPRPPTASEPKPGSKVASAPVPGSPEPVSGLQMQPQRGGAERKDPLPRAAGSAPGAEGRSRGFPWPGLEPWSRTARRAAFGQQCPPCRLPRGTCRLAPLLLQEQPPRLRGCRGLRPSPGMLHPPLCGSGHLGAGGGGRGHPCPHQGQVQARGRDVTVPTVTSCAHIRGCWCQHGHHDSQGQPGSGVSVQPGEFFANKLSQQPLEDVGLMGFLPEDICRTIERAAQQQCFVCGKSGAATTCCREGCNRSFHLPCTAEGGCVTQFFFQYRSFCGEHSPEQAAEAAPEKDTTCLLCLEHVGDRKSYGTMVCPACKHTWFHRGCIQVGAAPSPPGRQALSNTRASLLLPTFLLQGQAVRDGISCFQCPLCRDRDAFSSEMLSMGIRIPFSLPSQDPHAYDDLSERHSRCDACECLCPGGREQAEAQGPWQLLLCCSCAAEGTHRRCSRLRTSMASWECNSCAGLGTASSGSSELTSPSTSSQLALGQSHGTTIVLKTL